MFILYIYIYIYIYLWLRWVFVASHGLSVVVASRSYSLVAVCRLLIAAASLVLAWALGVRASVALPLSLGNCGPQP